jgi:hypothetical protein
MRILFPFRGDLKPDMDAFSNSFVCFDLEALSVEGLSGTLRVNWFTRMFLHES